MKIFFNSRKKNPPEPVLVCDCDTPQALLVVPSVWPQNRSKFGKQQQQQNQMKLAILRKWEYRFLILDASYLVYNSKFSFTIL